MRLITNSFFALIVLASTSYAQETINISYHRGIDTSGGGALDFLANSVEGCTGNSIEVEFYPDSKIVSLDKIIDSLNDGIVDIALVPSSSLNEYSITSNVLSIPFVFNNRKHWEVSLEGPLIAKIQEETFRSANINILDFFGGEEYGILSSSAIRTPSDLSGRKVRAVGSYTEVLESLGIASVPMSFAETYSALQTGVVDSVEISATGVLSQKYFEVADNYALTNHRILTEFLIMNGDRFDALSELARQCLLDAASVAAQASRIRNVEEETKALSSFTDFGVDISRVENRPTLFEQSATVRDSFISELGVEDAYSLISKIGACPKWCDEDSCSEEACEMCRNCER